MDDLQQFKETYINECYELLEDMEEKLLGLDEEVPDMEELNAIFRCAHSIKGGSGAFGFDRITKFTHILEELLDAMREERINPTREVIDALLLSVDIVRKMVSSAHTGEEAEEGIEDSVAKQLKEVVSSIDGGDEGEAAPVTESKPVPASSVEEIGIYDITFVPHKDLFLSGNEPLLLFRELQDLGKTECKPDISKLPCFEDFSHENCYISWNISLETDRREDEIFEVFEFVEDDCDLKIDKIAAFAKEPSSKDSPKEASENQEAPEKELVKAEPKPVENKAPSNSKNKEPSAENSKTPAITSIRVDIEKVDRLVNMVGELVISQALIVAQSDKLSFEEYPDLISGINTLSQHSRDLQEAVMSVRMQPVKSVFSRMPRIVRDLSSQLGKNIRLETEGENTELDKTVIEQLSDPLTHMIRNSVDHGISGPDEREKNGKPGQGVIKLSAAHKGGKIVLQIADDGEGINRERVLAKARDKELVAKDAQLSDYEIDNLIFRPGFSTAEVVSNVSGRGVGMDVVKRNIEALGGTINIINKPSEGSTFVVTLPLTLAILDGMIIRVGNEKYIIPISNIIETLRPKKEDVKKIADANDLINVRGDFISMLYLHKVFAIEGAKKKPHEALVILVENGLDKFGIVVDELIGQQQVVIKSLEENTEAVDGISAATILGDGKVALILDISNLQELMANIEKTGSNARNIGNRNKVEEYS